MWLGAGHLLQQVDISHIPVLFPLSRSCSQHVTLESYYRQPVVALWSYCCHLSRWFLSASTDPTSYSLTYFWCCYMLTFDVGWTVQLAALWCAGEPAEKVAFGAERCRSSTYQHSAPWPHHSGVATTSLAAGPETSGVQDCLSCTPIAGFNGVDDLSADIHLASEHGRHLRSLWPPCVIGQAIIFLPCGLYLSFFVFLA